MKRETGNWGIVSEGWHGLAPGYVGQQPDSAFSQTIHVKIIKLVVYTQSFFLPHNILTQCGSLLSHCHRFLRNNPDGSLRAADTSLTERTDGLDCAHVRNGHRPSALASPRSPSHPLASPRIPSHPLASPPLHFRNQPATKPLATRP